MHKKTGIFIYVTILLTQALFGQKQDSTIKVTNFSGTISLTNNGLSLIPTFSLGKPAALVILSVSGKRFSFDPDMRFALEGKPWSFLFWTRYKMVNTRKFQVNIGAHPAINFKTFPAMAGGKETIVARRFLAGELSPNYYFTKNISIGAYYLYSHGFDSGTPTNTHFITLNSNFSHLTLPGRLFLRINPQVYYLKQDDHDGLYLTSFFMLARKNFPVNLSSTINKTIKSNIPGSKDFVWNLGIAYSFHGKYFKKNELQ